MKKQFFLKKYQFETGLDPNMPADVLTSDFNLALLQKELGSIVHITEKDIHFGFEGGMLVVFGEYTTDKPYRPF